MGNVFISSVFSLSFLFLFLPCPSLSSLLLSLLSLFSLSLGDDTKWPTRVNVSLNPNTINLAILKIQLPFFNNLVWGWLGETKVSCILRHRGVQLILAYSWARPAILAAVNGWGGGDVFIASVSSLSFIFLLPLSLSFISSTTSSVSLLRFSGGRHKMTHKGWCVIKSQLNQPKKKNHEVAILLFTIAKSTIFHDAANPVRIQTFQLYVMVLTISALQTKTDTCANSVDPDEMAPKEPSHQDLHCLPFCF